jgi:Phage portal protein, SPP1 Gp6-like
MDPPNGEEQMAVVDLPHIDQVKRLSDELDRRVALHGRLEPYYENDDKESALPPAITQARLTKLYRYLMPVSEAPWGSLIVDSKLDRLEVSGITDPVNDNAAKACWDMWQSCHMDSESKLAHCSALIDGRCYALVWPDEDGNPDIALDDMTQMIVEYAEGSRFKRTGALRRWKEGDRTFATLYRPEGIYKFQGPKESANTPSSDVTWEKRPGDDEWPLPNVFPDQSIPVVELRVNGRLKPGRFPHARGEYAHVLGLIDRINLLTFLGLVVAIWMGFPLRGVTGQKIRHEVLRDDQGNALIDEATGNERTRPVPPFDAQPDSVFQLESPDAKIAEFKAADRSNLSIYAELDELAMLSKTARHYFPLENGMSNLAAEAIVASEGGMLAGVTGHKASLDDGWEEVARLGGMLLEDPVELSPRAELQWKKHESRSLAEQADAFVKLRGGAGGGGLPWVAAAEIALNATRNQLDRWQAEEATNPLAQLLAASQPANGNGVPAGGVPAQ